MKPRPSSHPLSTGKVKNSTNSEVAGPEAARLVLRDAPAESPDAHGVAALWHVVGTSSGASSWARSRRWRKRLSTSSARSTRSPCSMTRPWSSTTISSTRRSVDSRWAMINVVRPERQLGDGGLEQRSRSPGRCAPSPRRAPPGRGRAATPGRAPGAGPRRPTARRRRHRAGGGCRRRRARRARHCAAPTRPRRRSASSSNRVTLSRIVPLEQLDLLRDRARPGGAVRRAGCRSIGTPPSRNGAAGRLDQAQHQPRQRGLAAAGATDDADRSAGGEVRGRSTAARSGRRRSRSATSPNSMLSGPLRRQASCLRRGCRARRPAGR